MDVRVTATLAGQHGLITWSQLQRGGVTPAAIQQHRRAGDLIAVRRGVYADPAVWAANSRWDLRQVMRDRAASMMMHQPHRLSHDSAALRLGMQVLKQDGRTHVTLDGRRGTHTRGGVTRHYAPYRRGDIHPTGSLHLARTALDIAREHGVRSGTVAIDSALRLGATYPELHSAFEVMERWPHRARVRAALELSDPDTDSVAETLARELVEELGLGRPRTQFGISSEGRTVWCDLILARHVFEVHGALKFLAPEDGGIALDPRRAALRDKQRNDWVGGFKLGMSAIYWEDFWGPAREAAKARLTREFRDTCSRFGTDRSDLSQFKPSRPRPRRGSAWAA